MADCIQKLILYGYIQYTNTTPMDLPSRCAYPRSVFLGLFFFLHQTCVHDNQSEETFQLVESAGHFF